MGAITEGGSTTVNPNISAFSFSLSTIHLAGKPKAGSIVSIPSISPSPVPGS